MGCDVEASTVATIVLSFFEKADESRQMNGNGARSEDTAAGIKQRRVYLKGCHSG